MTNPERLKWNLVATLVIVISFSFVSCDISTEPKPVEDRVASDGYVLVWSDEFEQESSYLNTDYWSYHTGYGTRPYGAGNDGWGNDEWQLYTASQENVRVEDGKLIISAQCPSGVPGKRNGSVTSARVHTKNKFDMKYGKIQARIKVPTGMGMWPAFWMLGTNIDEVGWPTCGEIDIMESSTHLLGSHTTSFAIHWDERSRLDLPGEQDYKHKYETGVLEMSKPLSDDYHIYEVEWDQHRIVGRIDGETYFLKSLDVKTMFEFYNRFFLLLNVAVGGHMGGAPNETTVWPQNMYVDWIRAYELPVETFGIFTEKNVDDALIPELNCGIWVWEETLTAGSIPPYEGFAVLSFKTNNVPWYGAAIQSYRPLDLSDFENGYINFMIKMPGNITFKIGFDDYNGINSFVEFPKNETVYGLVRNGEWGRVQIPVSDVKGNVNIRALSNQFIILNEFVPDGGGHEFAIDEIYWSKGGVPMTSISFGGELYSVESSGAQIRVSDIGSANTTVSVNVSNGTESINVNFALDLMGNGTGTINFGATDDSTDTIAISEGDVLTLTYTDFYGTTRTTSTTIIIMNDYFGIFTDLSPVGDGLTIGEDSQIISYFFTEGFPLEEGSIIPYEGNNVLTFKAPSSGSWGAGIILDQPIDFSSYSDGDMNFMIKIPADVEFRISITGSSGNPSLLTFPANETKYGLIRNGEWGRASIPFSAFSNLSLTNVSRPFFIQGQSGGNWEFAVDDIYYNK